MAQGLLLIAMGPALNYLNFTVTTKKIIAWLLIITAWGNAIGYNVAALTGMRGLTYVETIHGSGLANIIVFISFMMAVVTVLIALVFIIIGSFRKSN
jgi:hypothetical protein